MKKYAREELSLEEQQKLVAKSNATHTVRDRQPKEDETYIIGKNGNPTKVKKGIEPAD